MNKWRFLIGLILIAASLFAQPRPIVQVDPVANLSDEAWLEAVCDAATDNVIFTLKFLGQFDVVSDTSGKNESGKLVNAMVIDQASFDTTILKTRAETEGYDNILFGSCTIEDGSYVITMNAYDLALDKITYSGSTVVESIFDTFEAVDQITYQTVEGFSGIHVTYGSLVLVPPDTGEPFSFTIDGIALSEGTFSVERMPAGVHELAISQERPLGLYEVVHKIEVVEESNNRINIPLPDIAGEEISVFAQADRYLTLASLGRRLSNVLTINNLNSLLGTPFFQEFRSELVNKYKTWISMLDGEIPISAEPGHSNVLLKKLSPWDSEKHIDVYTYNVSLSSQFHLLILRKEQLESKNIFVPNTHTITIDGKADDWANTSMVFRDNTDDLDHAYFIESFKEQGAGQDIAWVGVATDDERLFFAMETVSKIYRDDRFYIMEVNVGDLVDFRYDGSSKEFNGHLVRNRNWENSKRFNISNSPLRGSIDEIVEISFPLDRIEEWLQPTGGHVTLNFQIQRSSSPYHNIDSFVIQCVLPSIYNAFRADES